MEVEEQQQEEEHTTDDMQQYRLRGQHRTEGEERIKVLPSAIDDGMPKAKLGRQNWETGLGMD